jgi:hypothetical protein
MMMCEKPYQVRIQGEDSSENMVSAAIIRLHEASENDLVVGQGPMI